MSEREERITVWRCPECGWYWVDSDTLEERLEEKDAPDCDYGHGRTGPLHVVPLSAVEGLMSVLERLAEKLEGDERNLEPELMAQVAREALRPFHPEHGGTDAAS